MMRRFAPHPETTRTDREAMELAEWIFDSHNWEEYEPGYYKCLWCLTLRTSCQVISAMEPLCPKNPAVIRTATTAIAATIAEMQESGMQMGRMSIDAERYEVVIRISARELEDLAQRISDDHDRVASEGTP